MTIKWIYFPAHPCFFLLMLVFVAFNVFDNLTLVANLTSLLLHFITSKGLLKDSHSKQASRPTRNIFPSCFLPLVHICPNPSGPYLHSAFTVLPALKPSSKYIYATELIDWVYSPLYFSFCLRKGIMLFILAVELYRKCSTSPSNYAWIFSLEFTRLWCR